MYKEASEALARSHAALSETHEKLNYSTSHDPATGLLNREAFMVTWLVWAEMKNVTCCS
ncbi:hypothetical protein IG197_31120 (plasmid) [Aminobacter sp. SR38]|jgi:GGDEF domain-containing protein|uniref:hypothetical protein n=1 Tax=Aminobacter sp. SR38 TaxID=2774562 RepID=UPI001785E341|nr:hypothetical protein [Aminobacter sp. SR38]QOF75115.1 hypothetical protein IG197_31120 [Aminobacter sp. SR38]